MGKRTTTRWRPATHGPGKTGMREWIGGQIISPFYITEGDPYRPKIILWLEQPDDLVVAVRLIGPREPPVSFGATLLEATKSPMVGPPRHPARVRVADPRLAAEARDALPGMEVVVAPTPELEQLIQHMANSMPRGVTEKGPSYFEDGRVSAETM